MGPGQADIARGVSRRCGCRTTACPQCRCNSSGRYTPVSSTKRQQNAIVVSGSDGTWQKLSTPGVSIKILRLDKETGEATILLRLEPSATFPAQNHPGGEEVYVLEGDIKLGKNSLVEGDYLYTPPDGKHAVSTQGGCLILVTLPKPIEILKGGRLLTFNVTRCAH